MFQIPYTDIKPSITIHIINKWQTLWDEFPDNKLHQIEPIIGVRHLSILSERSRREEIVLSRIRVGHSHFTHCFFLLKGEPPPFCIPCNQIFSVKHILIDCVDFSDSRNHYFKGTISLAQLFREVNTNKILAFIKAIGLFRKF